MERCHQYILRSTIQKKKFCQPNTLPVTLFSKILLLCCCFVFFLKQNLFAIHTVKIFINERETQCIRSLSEGACYFLQQWFESFFTRFFSQGCSLLGLYYSVVSYEWNYNENIPCFVSVDPLESPQGPLREKHCSKLPVYY